MENPSTEYEKVLLKWNNMAKKHNKIIERIKILLIQILAQLYEDPDAPPEVLTSDPSDEAGSQLLECWKTSLAKSTKAAE